MKGACLSAAQVAKLVDALSSGGSAFGHGGSSPFLRTTPYESLSHEWLFFMGIDQNGGELITLPVWLDRKIPRQTACALLQR
jgi:hypothetical protein